MLTTTFSEFCNNVKKFFDAVECGETVEIYQYGKPAAVLSPVRKHRTERWKTASPITLKGVSAARMILEDRD